MLLVPYSSTNWMMFVRSPVRIEAMEMTVVTPMTIPSTVRKLRNLCARTLSNAITNVSLRTNDLNFTSFHLSVLGQRNDRIQSSRLHRRIDPKEHSYDAGNRDRKHNVSDGDAHRDRRCRANQPGDPRGEQQAQNSPQRAQHG